jgi:hypothetical protein
MRKILFVLTVAGVALGVLAASLFLLSTPSTEASTPPDEASGTSELVSDSGFPLNQGISYGYDQSTEPGSPILLRQSPLESYMGHEQGAWGNVQHRLVSKTEIVRLTPNFRVAEGRTTVLVLSTSETPTEAEIASADTTIDVQSPGGPQEYQVPSDLSFNSVAVYDPNAGAVLAIANLEPEPVCGDVPARSALSLEQPEDAPQTCVAIDPTQGLNVTGTAPDEVKIEDYRLTVDGLVDNPLELKFEDLKQYPSTSEVVLLICSGFFADNVEWTGVPVSAVLETAGVDPAFKALRITSGSDGYYVQLANEEYNFDDVILAYQVNGEDIPMEHGYPVRLVIKNEYGSKWVKWVKHIEVLEK